MNAVTKRLLTSITARDIGTSMAQEGTRYGCLFHVCPRLLVVVGLLIVGWAK